MAYIASKERVVKNTAFLYVRTLIMLVIGIFTSRITMQALGVDNYGIVNVVSGFVVMFTIISGSLTAACQRFITYEFGKAECDIQSVFSASIYIHICLGIIILILGETIGLYFVSYKLNIPDGRQVAAQWVYQCSLITFMLSLINIPFNALIIAHERMKVFAYISLLEAVLKLIIVVSILYLSADKLILYAILSLVSAILIRFTFQLYCKKTFGNMISLKRKVDKSLSKRIFGFAGWSFIGNSATICSNQGVNVALNLFCGVVVNAARGIAAMVESVIVSFVNNFTTALNPQITKAFASGEREQVNSLILLGIRVTFCLMIVLAIPIEIAASELLHIWFVDVPEYTVIFVRLTLCVALIQALGNPFLTLLLAIGEIRNYQIVVGGITILNFPISYLLLRMGYSPISVYILAVIISLTTFIIRLLFLRKLANIRLRSLVNMDIYTLIFAAIISVLFSVTIYCLFPSIDNLLRLVVFFIISGTTSVAVFYIISTTGMEKKHINRLIVERLHK